MPIHQEVKVDIHGRQENYCTLLLSFQTLRHLYRRPNVIGVFSPERVISGVQVANMPVPLAVQSKAARFAGFRIQPGAWMFYCCDCCVLSGRGPCDQLITRPEESYRL